MDDPYVTCETWMTCLRMCENYVDGCGKLPEDREGDGNAGILPR